jgi:hypothetical protein
MVTGKISVATTPTKVVGQDGSNRTVYVQCETAVVHLGGSTVSTTNGYHMDINDKITFNIRGGDDLWCVSGGTGVISYMVITNP